MATKKKRPQELPVVHVDMNRASERDTHAYDFQGAKRGAFYRPGAKMSLPREKIVNLSFDVSQDVAAALRKLRDTGFFGNGYDCASIAEELLRRTLLSPGVIEHWSKS